LVRHLHFLQQGYDAFPRNVNDARLRNGTNGPHPAASKLSEVNDYADQQCDGLVRFVGDFSGISGHHCLKPCSG
jgi:hypothetical protein